MSDQRRLTSYSHGAGCGCKLSPSTLATVLAPLEPMLNPDLLIGLSTGDDAAVYRWSDDRALVATIDFFTPIVDDARTWGRIAAANAVSDVYAMGGRPLFALNVVAWNLDELGPEMLSDVLAGGQDAAKEAAFVIAGGHSIDDPEPKYGLAVVGEVDPAQMMTNAGFRAGDRVVLTKPIGVGVLTTAAKRGLATEADLLPAVTEMTRLNDQAADVATRACVSGATDITGFGLLGHLQRAAEESGVRITIEPDWVPILPGVAEFVEAGAVPGGGTRNAEHVMPRLDNARGYNEAIITILCDPQTSGGLAMSVGPELVDDVVSDLRSTGHTARVIGTVHEGPPQLSLG